MTFDMQYALEHFTDILQAAPVAIWVTVFQHSWDCSVAPSSAQSGSIAFPC